MRTNIIVNFTYEGIHFWEGCEIEEVSFLKYPHRHIFYFTLKKNVIHNDRDIEIIMFQREVINWLDITYNHNFGPMSCEMIANELVSKFDLVYCKVLEDNENGAEVISE